MKNSTPLKIIVELYRLASRPAISGLYLPLRITYSKNSDVLFKQLISSGYLLSYVDEDEFIIDGNVYENDLFPPSWTSIDITIKLPRDSIHRFHNSVSDLIQFSSVRNGDFPDDFYITELDYYSDEDNVPPEINKIKTICRLIKSLSKLAHYHDKKATDGEPRLVFIQGSEGKSKSAVLQPVITQEMLNYTDVDCSIVEQLQDENPSDDINHHVEKRGIFRNTIVEFVNENGYEFEKLIQYWTDFRLAYDNNLSVYLSGFNFHKSRKEVAAAELEFAEKISKTISELTTKIFAIPLSLLAAVGLWKLSNLTEQLVILSGVLFTSIIVNLIIRSQSKQLKRITHSKNMVFSPFELKLKKYPTELQADISKAIGELNANERFSKRVLVFFYVLCWIPTLAGIIIIWYKYISIE